MAEYKEESVVVFWKCDKQRCGQNNFRTLPSNHIIVEDECDFCGQYIMEPITKSVNFYGDAIFSGLTN